MSLSTIAKLPIVKIAAGAVVIAATVGVGVMTGLIPGVASKEQSVQTAPAVQTTPDRTERAKPAKIAARPVCADCGIVESIHAVELQGEATGAGAVVGAVAGLVVGNQIGSGRGKTLAKVAGATGGAYAGHQVEKNMKKAVQYEIAVRMDDGTMRTLTHPSGYGLSPGTRIRLAGDTIVRE